MWGGVCTRVSAREIFFIDKQLHTLETHMVGFNTTTGVILAHLVLLIMLLHHDIVGGSPSVNTRRSVDVQVRLQIMQTMLRVVSSQLAYVVLFYGTLLGQYRENQFICYDYDVDLFVFDDYFPTAVNLVRAAFAELPAYTTHYSFGRKSLEVWHVETGISLDLMCFTAGPTGVYRSFPPLCHRIGSYFLNECTPLKPTSWILPLKPVDGFYSCPNVYIPARPAKVLECLYGPGFETPDHRCSRDCRVCTRV
jgi:hypothetical protein